VHVFHDVELSKHLLDFPKGHGRGYSDRGMVFRFNKNSEYSYAKNVIILIIN